jgi:hypothetical protein
MSYIVRITKVGPHTLTHPAAGIGDAKDLAIKALRDNPSAQIKIIDTASGHVVLTDKDLREQT